MENSIFDTSNIFIFKARKLFCLCDENGKGFVVKADLKRIEGFIPGMSPSKMESLFDAIDSSKTNFVTESQFVEGISKLILDKLIVLAEFFKIIDKHFQAI